MVIRFPLVAMMAGYRVILDAFREGVWDVYGKGGIRYGICPRDVSLYIPFRVPANGMIRTRFFLVCSN